MDGTENSRFLTVEEVASLLRKKERTIREWCYNRSIPHYKVGNSILFKEDEISEWVSEYCRVEIIKRINEKKRRTILDSHPPRLKFMK